MVHTTHGPYHGARAPASSCAVNTEGGAWAACSPHRLGGDGERVRFTTVALTSRSFSACRSHHQRVGMHTLLKGERKGRRPGAFERGGVMKGIRHRAGSARLQWLERLAAGIKRNGPHRSCPSRRADFKIQGRTGFEPDFGSSRARLLHPLLTERRAQHACQLAFPGAQQLALQPDPPRLALQMCPAATGVQSCPALEQK
mmetsp:Transcript_3740/g.10538  ORF Transcript_3740/g.10538 Transcript_3740/m.10538 type:complete len:200 (-) Transcript_3740:2419-3018(-)|eukprot:355676-Chlamydomonas_euryale.AAC.6